MTEHNANNLPAFQQEFNALQDAWADSRKKKDEASIDAIVQKLENLASQGYDEALCLLGYIFQQRDDKQRDELRALDYFEQATKRNVPLAFLAMGLAYGRRNDNDKAFEHFRRGAELGNACCMDLTGSWLIAGMGTAKDALSGIRWIKKSADAGFPQAQLSYAQSLIDGDLIGLDLDKAIELLEPLYRDQNQSNDHAEIAWKLYLAYSKKGDSACKQKADEWLRIAAKLDHEKAKKMLVNIKQNDLWDSLKDFSVGEKHFSFFYKQGKIIRKRTETKSDTSGIGVNGNVVINTRHSSWQVVELFDQGGNLFEIYPDTPLEIPNGTEVKVIYIRKSEEDTGYPIICVDHNTGKWYGITTMELAVESLGLLTRKQINIKMAAGIASIFLFTYFMQSTGMSYKQVINSIAVYSIIALVLVVTVWFRRDKVFTSLTEHTQKIARFLVQGS